MKNIDSILSKDQNHDFLNVFLRAEDQEGDQSPVGKERWSSWWSTGDTLFQRSGANAGAHSPISALIITDKRLESIRS